LELDQWREYPVPSEPCSSRSRASPDYLRQGTEVVDVTDIAGLGIGGGWADVKFDLVWLTSESIPIYGAVREE
jgi:hypothetical protein